MKTFRFAELAILVLLSLALLLPANAASAASTNRPPLVGYYMTFMRMPVMDLSAWKDTLAAIHEDGANTIVLWMGGGFRSKKFPITWAYNQEHKNVQQNFFPELIRYAHRQKIRVLLGFTPFGYDGVNQYPIQYPELKARKLNGDPVDPFGIHSWGWSLCPSKTESQTFMLEYAREMFAFYPGADGFMIESSDYNVCRCPDCREHYYDREFHFVEAFSKEVWAAKPNATILVYPHYFTGKKVNAGTDIEATSARKPFDPRWQLVFTPHSARIENTLLSGGASGIYSDQGLSLGTPVSLRQGAQVAKRSGLGYLPSFEPFSYVPTHDEFGATHLTGRRLSPLGFDWMTDPKRPLHELPSRLLRFTFRELTKNPDLPDSELHRRIAQHFFNDPTRTQQVEDLLFLQECLNWNRDWVAGSPVVDPEVFKLKSAREKWSAIRLQEHQARLGRIRELKTRYAKARHATEREMERIATFIVERWN
jgi:hypothetical protein